MAVNTEQYSKIKTELDTKNVLLVAVSKTKPIEDIKELYDLGQRDFGENYVQELCEKYEQLPKDIRWHFIGHLQTNKVKLIAPFVYLIHGTDSVKLLQEINKQGAKLNRTIKCLLQVHIAQEETKFGFDDEELANVPIDQWTNVQINGLMGMASFTDDMEKVRSEFKHLKILFDSFAERIPSHVPRPTSLSIGMSADYKIAVEEGSTMVRIGSLLFGSRN